MDSEVNIVSWAIKVTVNKIVSQHAWLLNLEFEDYANKDNLREYSKKSN